VTTAFFDQLANWGEAIACVDDTGNALSYVALAQQADQFARQLGSQRQLVAMLANNSQAALVVYLACLRHRHPLLMLPAALDQAALEQLVSTFSVSVVCRPDTTAAHWSWTGLPAPVMHADLALLLSTSGSTGARKCVKLSRRNLQSNAESISAFLPITEGDTAITAMPMCYSYGLSVINTHLLKGARLVITETDMMSRRFWTLFRQQSVNSFSGVPYAYRLLQRMRFEGMALPALKYLTQAGGRLDENTLAYLRQLASNKQLPCYLMYGQTEATARMAYLPPARLDAHTKAGCIGQPIDGGELTLIDHQGVEIRAEGKTGELIYRGDNVMMGYASRAADLSAAGGDNMLHTGDLAQRQGKDFYITGRKRRMIKIAGLRYSLDDLEQLLGRGVFCLGGDDHLIVVREKYSAATQEDIHAQLQQCRIHASFVQLREVASMPRTASGKPDYPAVNND
jgi:acyl-CoA synthetase (AMP-forming)/AMP-acid ligase II